MIKGVIDALTYEGISGRKQPSVTSSAAGMRARITYLTCAIDAEGDMKLSRETSLQKEEQKKSKTK